MNLLVRFTADDDGSLVENDPWHLVDPTQPMGSASKLCTGEVFGMGEGGAIYETKEVKKGGITCPNCLNDLGMYKAVKL